MIAPIDSLEPAAISVLLSVNSKVPTCMYHLTELL